ncbi:MAG: MFS transporter [Thermodesulfovibrionales bacterium]|nr:MFS transporter [Thermodesulfovibrionales bacterium]
MNKRFFQSPYLEVFHNRRITATALLGFSSGLPLALTGGTLQAWMTVDGVDLKTIGIFSLVSLPYTLKFLWSPLMDRFVLPWLGRRRGWILFTQIWLILSIALMSLLSPAQSPLLLAVLALVVAFASSSQDIVIDAYRTDVLREKERGAGAAVSVLGYRIALLVSGSFALILSEYIRWNDIYLLMSLVMLIGVITTLFAPEPERVAIPPKTMQEAIVGPMSDFFRRKNSLLILLLIILYKLGDAYAGTLTTAFLIRGIGFSAGEVGTINKGFGLVCVIIGSLVGGAWMVKLGLYTSLLFFGVLQAISNLSFILLAYIGKSYEIFVFTIAFENFTGGMGTSAFVALLMALCNSRFTATQYALLSSLSAIGRIFISPSAGFLVESVGWIIFFLISTLLALPGLWLLFLLKKRIANLSERGWDDNKKLNY